MKGRRALIAAGGVVVAIVALAVILLPSDSKDPLGPIVLVEYVDCSLSMGDVLPSFDRAAREISHNAVRAHSLLIAGSFAGRSPGSSLPWSVVHRFEPSGANKTKAIERMELNGEPVVGRVRKLLSCPEGVHRGSPLLSALEAAGRAIADAHLPWSVQRRVVIYSDGAIMGDGFDVRQGISPAQITAGVKTWGPRLAGLRQAGVWIIGANSGIHGVPSDHMRAAQSLFDQTLTAAHGRLVTFGPSEAGYPFDS